MNRPAETSGVPILSEIADVIDELAERIGAGQDIDLVPYRDRVSDPAQLEMAVEALRQVMQLRAGSPCGLDAEALNVPPDLPPSLADFQLLREIGRGGMGIVYEARQLSLDRRIAVKILPLAGLRTERQLERFRNESRAAALLIHPNIVRVYSSGVEEGIHFYAMDLIDGGTVADVIGQLRASRVHPTRSIAVDHGTTDGRTATGTNDDRNVPRHDAPATNSFLARVATDYTRSPRQYCDDIARWGATLADAIQYAHEQGVIHRDLKPSNLLLDREGRPYVADFGLAHVAGDVSLTATGDRLGTLRYMSPEQAQGRKVLDHRTDIYSLGVTLYELLALSPPFASEDRAELLRALDDSQPPSLRALTSYVPHDLETIILKAIAKAAEDRYPTAQELADDLRRFLEQKPVHARRTTWSLRLRRWAQRHRLAAGLAASTIFLLALFATIGPLMAWRYANLAQREAQARTMSDGLRDELQSLVRDTLTTSVETLENLPGIDPMHRKLVDAALEQDRKLLALDPGDDELRLDVANSLIRLARVVNLSFDQAQALEIVREAIDLVDSRFGEAPVDPRVLTTLAEGYFSVGTFSWSRKDMAKSVMISEQLVQSHSNHGPYLLLLGWSKHYLGKMLRGEGSLQHASDATRQAIIATDKLLAIDPTNQEYRLCQISAIHTLACIQQDRRMLAEADEGFRRCIQLSEPLKHLTRSNVRSRIAYDCILQDYGRNLLDLGRYEEAEIQLREATRDLEEVVRGHGNSDWAVLMLAFARITLAECLAATVRTEEAEAEFRRAIACSSECHDEMVKAYSHYGLAELLWRSGRQSDAHELFAVGINWARKAESNPTLARWLATCPDETLRQPEEAVRHAQLLPENNEVNRQVLGFAQFRAGHWEQSIESLKSVHFGNCVDDGLSAFYLALAYHKLNDLAAARHWYDQGLTASPRLPVKAELLAVQREAASALGLQTE